MKNDAAATDKLFDMAAQRARYFGLPNVMWKSNSGCGTLSGLPRRLSRDSSGRFVRRRRKKKGRRAMGPAVTPAFMRALIKSGAWPPPSRYEED